MNSDYCCPSGEKKLVAALEDEVPPMLKRRMSREVFVLIILVANAALALAANVIVRLLSN